MVSDYAFVIMVVYLLIPITQKILLCVTKCVFEPLPHMCVHTRAHRRPDPRGIRVADVLQGPGRAGQGHQGCRPSTVTASDPRDTFPCPNQEPCCFHDVVTIEPGVP